MENNGFEYFLLDVDKQVALNFKVNTKVLFLIHITLISQFK